LSYTADVDAIDISFDNVGSVVLFLSKIYSSVILNDPRISSMPQCHNGCCLILSVLFVVSFATILFCFYSSNSLTVYP